MAESHRRHHSDSLAARLCASLEPVLRVMGKAFLGAQPRPPFLPSFPFPLPPRPSYQGGGRPSLVPIHKLSAMELDMQSVLDPSALYPDWESQNGNPAQRSPGERVRRGERAKRPEAATCRVAPQLHWTSAPLGLSSCGSHSWRPSCSLPSSFLPSSLSPFLESRNGSQSMAFPGIAWWTWRRGVSFWGLLLVAGLQCWPCAARRVRESSEVGRRTKSVIQRSEVRSAFLEGGHCALATTTTAPTGGHCSGYLDCDRTLAPPSQCSSLV